MQDGGAMGAAAAARPEAFDRTDKVMGGGESSRMPLSGERGPRSTVLQYMREGGEGAGVEQRAALCCGLLSTALVR